MGKSFSERMGHSSAPMMQLGEMGVELKNSLWNEVLQLFEGEEWSAAAKIMARVFFKVPADELPPLPFHCRTWVKDRYYALEWHRAYSFIEVVCELPAAVKRHRYRQREVPPYLQPKSIQKRFNEVLEREVSGYRFVNGLLEPITNAGEIAEIEQALDTAANKGFAGARSHLETALKKLAERPTPDHRNAIKEAISAVESVATKITGRKADGLSKALAKLEESTGIHGALKSAFDKLYGYSSDEEGIRHCLIDECNVDFDDAKFMVISCSAFVNYLIGKATKAGLA